MMNQKNKFITNSVISHGKSFILILNPTSVRFVLKIRYGSWGVILYECEIHVINWTFWFCLDDFNKATYYAASSTQP